MNDNIVLDAAGFAFGVRVYRAPEPCGAAVVWLHGGAFMFGDLDMPEADAVARSLAGRGISVVSVDYTLASLEGAVGLPGPEEFEGLDEVGGLPDPSEAFRVRDDPRAPFPVASLQTVAAFDWAAAQAAELGADPTRIALGGASAGGNLAAGAALRLRDRGAVTPSALLLAYPVLHAQLPPADASLLAALEGIPVALTFPPESVAAINANYLAGADAGDPYAFPAGGRLHGLPPTLLLTAERDRLRSSAEAFAAQLIDAGVDAAVVRAPGALHGFLNEPANPASARAVDHMVAAVA